MAIKPLHEILENPIIKVAPSIPIVTGDESAFMSPITEFFGKLFQSRDTAHIIHLATKSFEIHKTLNDYYEAIIDIIDSLIEQYQGMYGLVQIKIPSSCYQDPLDYFQTFIQEVKDARKLFKDSNLQNTVDEILDLLSSTLYKLRFLK